MALKPNTGREAYDEVKKRPQQQAPSKWEQLQQEPSKWEKLQQAPSKWEQLQSGALTTGLRTGSLSDKAKLIGPKSGRIRRAMRGLYGRAKQEMMLMMAMQKLNEPTIKSQDYRSELSKRHAKIAAQKARNLAAGYGAIRTPAMDAGNTPNDNKWANSPYTPTRYY